MLLRRDLAWTFAFFCSPYFPASLPLSARRSESAQLHRARVTLETFHPRQSRHRRPEPAQRARRGLDYTGSLEEIVSTQRRGETGGAAGRQNVIGAGQIVAERRRADRADERPHLRLTLREPSRGMADIELQMLGRDSIGQLERLIKIAHHHDRAALRERAPDGFGARQIG